MPFARSLLLVLFVLFPTLYIHAADEKLDLGDVTEKHEMIPMRDGVRLSAYFIFPQERVPGPCFSNNVTPTPVPITREKPWQSLANMDTSFACRAFAVRNSPKGSTSVIAPLGGEKNKTVSTRWNGLPGSGGRPERWARSAARKAALRRISWPLPNRRTSSANT